MPRLTLIVSFLLVCVVSAAAQSSNIITNTGPQRDPSATTFLTQAVTAAGGSSAISAIQDFTAQGTITHNWGDNPEQGQLAVKSRGLSQFRIDSSLPEGTWSWVVNNNSGQLTFPDGTLTSIPYHNTPNVGSLTLPICRVNSALSDLRTSVIDLGTVKFGTGQARQIRIQQTFRSDSAGWRSKLTQRDYFFDPASFSLLEVRDTVHPQNDAVNGQLKHTVNFGNYKTVNGVAVPFSVSETIAGQHTWTLQLSSIAFNTGLSDSDFQF